MLGRTGSGPVTNGFPAYSPNVMSDAQLQTIYEYISSIPEPPAVEDIPALRDLL
jgi:hypothetical protein